MGLRLKIGGSNFYCRRRRPTQPYETGLSVSAEFMCEAQLSVEIRNLASCENFHQICLEEQERCEILRVELFWRNRECEEFLHGQVNRGFVKNGIRTVVTAHQDA